MNLRDPYSDYPPEQQAALGALWGTVVSLALLILPVLAYLHWFS